MLSAVGKTIGLAAGVAAVALALPASAATMRTSDAGGMPVILVSGAFAYGDGERFETLSRALPKSATVVFDSPGGNLLAGLKIGETIRARGYATLVPGGSLCTSACAIAWLGGTKRYLAAGARLGFHAASGQYGVSAPGNAIVGAYMARLGLKQDAIYELTAASPDDIAWLDLPTARTMGIAAEAYTGPSFGGSPSIAASGAPQVASRPGHYGNNSGTSAGAAPIYAPPPMPAPASRNSASCAAYTYGGHGACRR